jgi:hypothetical protein
MFLRANQRREQPRTHFSNGLEGDGWEIGRVDRKSLSSFDAGIR